MALDFKVNINELPLEALIIVAASKRKVKITVADETCLSVNNNVQFTSNISAMRYLANTDDSQKWMGSNALERCEINHWVTYSVGQLASKDNFQEALEYLDRVIAPVTFLVGNQCSLADVVVWSKLFKLPKWIDILQTNTSPTNITRWYTFIASLDFVKEALSHVGSLTNNFPGKLENKEVKSTSAIPESNRKDEGKFIDLPGAEMGKVVVRFPPEASGYLHIGHAKAALLNQYYKEAFNGQLIMRFDDTNPAKEKEDFEKVILEDMKLLKIDYDKYSHTSDYFEIMLEMCEKLIKEGKAYVDDTNAEDMKKEREKKICSKNRDNNVQKNLAMWNEMKNGTAKGQMCCVRAKIDMSSLNGCMRDPTIYRCKNETHPRTGNKYKVYPTYDFACPIVDSLEGVTHCLRTMEYHDRDEQFYWFIDVLGLRKPHIWEYSRLNMTNTVLSKRKLTWFVENRYVKGWDDPRMPTVRGVLRRGMTVEGLRQFIIAQGSSRSVVLMEWDKIWAFNKKVIDPVAPRYTAVDAKKIPVQVLDIKESSVQVAKHPKNPEVGEKTIWTAPRIFVDEVDAAEFKENENVTFINWGNLTIKKIIKESGRIVEVVAVPNLEDKNYKKTMKITWIADTEKAPLIPVVCLYFDHIISKAILGKDEDFKKYIDHHTMFKAEMLGEPELASVKQSEIIQLQRKGFFICDQPYMEPSIQTFAKSPLVLIYIPDGHSKGLPPGLVAVDKKLITATHKNPSDLIKEFVDQKNLVRKMRLEMKNSAEIEPEIQKLTSLSELCQEFLLGGWPSSSTPITTSLEDDKSQKAKDLLNKIADLGDEIRKLKAEKSDKTIIAERVKSLLQLKASFKEETGEEWKPGISIEKIFNKNTVGKISQEMGHGGLSSISTQSQVPLLPTSSPECDKTQKAKDLLDKIADLGDEIRKLKAEKSDKTIITEKVKLLLQLKASFKEETGEEWKPGISIEKIFNKNTGGKINQELGHGGLSSISTQSQVPLLPSSSSGDNKNQKAKDLLDKIANLGDEIRRLKAEKSDKTIIAEKVKLLLQLKASFKEETGEEWKPGISIEKTFNKNTAGRAEESSIEPLSGSSELCSKIIELSRSLQKMSSDGTNAVVEEQINLLRKLRADFKALTGFEWKPHFARTNEMKFESNDNFVVIHRTIYELDKKVKSNEKLTNEEENLLLTMKTKYKCATGKEWTPESAAPFVSKAKFPWCPPAINPLTPATETSMVIPANENKTNGNSQLSDKIKSQGDKVRQLKSEKAEKSIIDAEVKILLNLKSEFKSLTGKEWTPESNVIGQKIKNDNAPVKDKLNEEIASLTEKIKNQGNVVRTMKANNTNKEQLNEAIQKLLLLKEDYKSKSGQDFPSEAKASDKKSKSSSKIDTNKKNKSDSNKKEQIKTKPTKQEQTENESGLKKITRLGLEAKKEENLPEWYSQIIVKSELIEYYDISGCYILRPWSYAIWEAIKDFLDNKIKLMGVKNCYFPIFVSKAVLEKEKTHIADFAPEVAWVTKSGESDLAEPIAVRPTSETVMYPAYAKWIQSYRDLPIKLNQWNNVVRWEFKHPQPFLRTREFLWQEGHTAFATYEEATAEVYTMLDNYAKVYTDLLAVPVVKGRKTEKEKFAGGDFTLTVEAYISASGRAIQGGTSHHLGQNFSKMFEIIFEDPVTQEKKFVYQNSWGLTTRTIGVLIMVHADNQGLVLPPRVASIQVVIVPCGITASLKKCDKDNLLETCNSTYEVLTKSNIRCELDDRENYSPGWKFNHWELKGVPIRMEIGPKDLEKNQVVVVRRDTGEKLTIPSEPTSLTNDIQSLLDKIQSDLLMKATNELKQHMIVCKDWNIFCQELDNKNIILSPFCGKTECEDKIKEESARNDPDVDTNAPSMGAKTLCVPFDQPAKITSNDKCIHPTCRTKPEYYCLFGRSY